MKTKALFNIIGFCVLTILAHYTSFAQDLVILGGNYDQAEYPGYKTKGKYDIQITKTDSYTFTSGQFEINVSLPPQGVYDPSRQSEVMLPAGWEMIVAPNDNGSFILRLTEGSVYAGAGAGINRRRDFSIPIITTAAAVDQPTLVTVQWNDFEVNENPVGNSAGSVLNVRDVSLPVVLVSFTATAENATSALQWSTTSETNSDQFEVERSQNGKTWNKIGAVTSSGESNVLKNYFFTDSKPANGENLYRLKMIDLDGTFAYSTIRSLVFDNIQAFVYPNPTSDKLFVKDFENVKNLTISNLSGMKVLDMKQVPSDGIDIKHLSPGIHTVSLILLNGTPYTHKFVVSK